MADSETYSGLTKQDALNRAATYDPQAQVQIIPEDGGLFTLDVIYPDVTKSSLSLAGKMSVFGGPDDKGVKPSEGLALMNESDLTSFDSFFLTPPPENTSGLARRLNPNAHYIACRWNYSVTSKSYLKGIKVKVTNLSNRMSVDAQPVDWGPSEATDRIADLSPGLAGFLGLRTNDRCRVDIPLPASGGPATSPSLGDTELTHGSFYTDVISKDSRFNSVQPIGTPDLLEPITRQLVQSIITDAAALGINLMPFETYRSRERQEMLFNEGATQLKTVGVHHYGLACDLVRVLNGEPSWKGDFSLLGRLAYKYGLIWGGDWGNPTIHHSFVDDVHVQRCALGRQQVLFSGSWYPDLNYNPYEATA
jgi:hypothetical protein